MYCVWGSCETSREHFWWHIIPFSCCWSVDFSIYLKIFVIWFVSFYVQLSQWRMHFDALNSKRSEEQTEVCKHFPVKTSLHGLVCCHQAQIIVDFASILPFLHAYGVLMFNTWGESVYLQWKLLHDILVLSCNHLVSAKWAFLWDY